MFLHYVPSQNQINKLKPREHYLVLQLFTIVVSLTQVIYCQTGSQKSVFWTRVYQKHLYLTEGRGKFCIRPILPDPIDVGVVE